MSTAPRFSLRGLHSRPKPMPARHLRLPRPSRPLPQWIERGCPPMDIRQHVVNRRGAWIRLRDAKGRRQLAKPGQANDPHRAVGMSFRLELRERGQSHFGCNLWPPAGNRGWLKSRLTPFPVRHTTTSSRTIMNDASSHFLGSRPSPTIEAGIGRHSSTALQTIHIFYVAILSSERPWLVGTTA